jgi:hypothetical protein
MAMEKYCWYFGYFPILSRTGKKGRKIMTRPAAITHPQKEENNEEKLSRFTARTWRALSSGRNFYTHTHENVVKN